MALSPAADARLRRLAGPAASIGGLLPLAWTVFLALTGGLSADPVEDVTHRTGFAALCLLMASLAVTPLRRLTGWNGVVGARRTLGLLAFGYAALHFLVYMVDQEFAWEFIVEDIAERPYVTVGFTALLLLLALALTSTRASIRRLGRRWVQLHRAVYPAGLLAVLHFLWLVKSDLREPLIFAGVFAGLMAFRVPGWLASARGRGGGRKARGGGPAGVTPGD